MSYTNDLEMSTFSYKRITHFEDCMKQVQGKESYSVPIDIIQATMRELYADRVTDISKITQSMIRTTLKRLRLRRAYDHVAQIFTRITGISAPRISADQEERCRKMFFAMQPSFDRHCPATRKNFLSYNYVLYRCFHLLGLNHMLKDFSLLKGKENLALADEIFKSICADLGWNFVPMEMTLIK